MSALADVASIHLWYGELPKPDIMEFVFSDQYLHKRMIYPRQATLLKLATLQTELFTDYDWAVIEEWASDFHLDPDRADDDPHFRGSWGIPPDIEDRIATNRASGRRWFRQLVMAAGRRASKGFLGATLGSYVLWNFMAKGNPQRAYGIEEGKDIYGLVFGSKKQYAKANLWKDLADTVRSARCFDPYIAKAYSESLILYAPYDRHRMEERRARGVDFIPHEMATFHIDPRESTLTAGRGFSAFLLMFDEMAHVNKTSARADASEVYDATEPSLDQFGNDGMIYAPSSPWQKQGKFYELYRQGLLVDAKSMRAVDPTTLIVQLASWDLYKDWDQSRGIGIRPPAAVLYSIPLVFPQPQGPMSAYDDKMKMLERMNPATFSVERRGKFAEAMDAYLNPDRVADMFKDWGGRRLEMQKHGALNRTYIAHGDPARVNDRFGFAIGHIEHDDDGIQHVVLDLIEAYDPSSEEWSSFDDDGNPRWELDYVKIEDRLWENLQAFMPAQMTFDQFASPGVISRLENQVRKASFSKSVQVFEETATAPLNLRRAEVFKAALNMGRVHAPYHPILDDELCNLQWVNGKVDHPSTGEVQTKDVYDCVAQIVWALIGEDMEATVEGLSALPRASSPAGTDVVSHLPAGEDQAAQLSSLTRQLSQASPGGLARGVRR